MRSSSTFLALPTSRRIAQVDRSGRASVWIPPSEEPQVYLLGLTQGLLVAFAGTALVLLRGEGTGEIGAAGVRTYVAASSPPSTAVTGQLTGAISVWFLFEFSVIF